ncbi:hypothetical protein ACO0LF_16690 [Undibacterium sp. Di27W]|uniref:hypothetical protein n=1 Tax=Undibacterium sp. Di27W TaxID=3413036 RepID=UPI003BF15CFD
MKNYLLFCMASLLATPYASFAQGLETNLHQIALLSIVKLHYTTADELESFCTLLDSAYGPRFVEKRVEWDKDIKTMYVNFSAMSTLMGNAKPSSSAAASTGKPIMNFERISDMAKQLSESKGEEIPAYWKEIKLKKNIKEDLLSRMSGMDEAEQKRRCDYALTKKGMPDLPPRDLP